MIDIKDIKTFNGRYRKELEIRSDSTEAEKLKSRIIAIMHRKSTKDEIVDLNNDISRFLKGNPSKSDKDMILKYSETVAILYDAVEKGLLK